MLLVLLSRWASASSTTARHSTPPSSCSRLSTTILTSGLAASWRSSVWSGPYIARPPATATLGGDNSLGNSPRAWHCHHFYRWLDSVATKLGLAAGVSRKAPVGRHSLGCWSLSGLHWRVGVSRALGRRSSLNSFRVAIATSRNWWGLATLGWGGGHPVDVSGWGPPRGDHSAGRGRGRLCYQLSPPCALRCKCVGRARFPLEFLI